MNPAIKISGYFPKWSNKRNEFVPGCIPYETDFYLELERIKNGHYRDIVEKCRAITDKKLRTAFKAQYLPAITLSCICKEWRKATNVVSHSGLMNIDIDDSSNNIDNWPALRDQMAKVPIVVAAFLSASGKGLSIVVKVRPEQHYDCFKNIELELKKRFGIIVDGGVHDTVRLRFVSYDPDAYINYDFDSIPVVELTEDYIQQRDNKLRNPPKVAATGAANSLVNFYNAIKIAENEYCFTDGQKHNFLCCLAGYCNTTGMKEDVCHKYVIHHYGPQTTISDEDLLQPIRNVYRRYFQQHGETPVRKTTISHKHLRWLLTYIDKELLRRNIEHYGNTIIAGEDKHIIKVSSPLLAFFMWVACPEYTWTTADPCNQVFSNEDCKNIIEPDAVIDECNGNRLWVHKNYRYPLMWD